MKTRMRSIIIIILQISFGVGCFAQSINHIDWKSDLEYLKKELPQNHIDLFFSMTENEFNKGVDNIIQQLPMMNDYGVADLLLKHIAKIKDNNIFVDFGTLNNPNKILPFSLYWFNKGLYILATKHGCDNLLGKKLVKINDFKIEQIIDSLSTLIPFDSYARIKNNVPKMICFLPHLNYFGFTKDETVSLEIEDYNGVYSVYKIKNEDLIENNWIRFKPDSIAFCWKNKNKFFDEQYFEKDSIYYLQYNTCYSKELAKKSRNPKEEKNLPSFKKFEKKVIVIMKKKPVKKLVIDLRFNNGGSYDQLNELISKLQDYKKVNQKGKLFVVIGKQTFSSGLVNMIDFKGLTQAIFLGEESSGRPSHFGDVNFLILPSSGLRISYPTKYYKYADEDKNSFRLDVKIETNFSDYKKGIDPVFDYIKTIK